MAVAGALVCPDEQDTDEADHNNTLQYEHRPFL